MDVSPPLSRSSSWRSGNNAKKYSPQKLDVYAMKTVAQTLPHASVEPMVPRSVFGDFMICRHIVDNTCAECFDYLAAQCCNEYSSNEFAREMNLLYEEFTDFCRSCAEKIKHLPTEEYIARLTHLMVNEEYWRDYFESYFGLSPCEIANWHFKTLTLEQALILKMHPNEAPEFCGEYVHVAETLYKVEYRGAQYCSSCVGHYIDTKSSLPKFVVFTRYNRIHAELFLEDYFWNEEAWCSRCLYTPLFELCDNDGEYTSMDYVYISKAKQLLPEFVADKKEQKV